jgi:hypothetical protein
MMASALALASNQQTKQLGAQAAKADGDTEGSDSRTPFGVRRT